MNINIFNGYQSTVPAVIKFRQWWTSSGATSSSPN